MFYVIEIAVSDAFTFVCRYPVKWVRNGVVIVAKVCSALERNLIEVFTAQDGMLRFLVSLSAGCMAHKYFNLLFYLLIYRVYIILPYPTTTHFYHSFKLIYIWNTALCMCMYTIMIDTEPAPHFVSPPSNHPPLTRCFLPWDAETGRFMLMRVDIMNQTTRCFTANVFHI